MIPALAVATLLTAAIATEGDAPPPPPSPPPADSTPPAGPWVIPHYDQGFVLVSTPETEPLPVRL